MSSTNTNLYRRMLLLLVALIVGVVFVLIRRQSGFSGARKLPLVVVNTSLSTENQNMEDLNTPNLPPSDAENINTSMDTTPQCADSCSPCSDSPEYSKLTCQDIRETKPKVWPKVDRGRKVILSSDTVNYFYAWYAPFTTLLWMEVMKWNAVYIIVYKNESELASPVLKYIIRHVEAVGGEVMKIKNTLLEPYYLRSMVVSTSRFAISSRDWPGDPYMLISDMDMWPMGADIFNAHTSFPSSVHMIQYGGYMLDRSIPGACYVGMSLSIWREVMQIKKGDDIMKTIATLRDLLGKHPLPKAQQWSVDQKSFANRLRTWKGFPKEVHVYSRNFGQDRLDRKHGIGSFVWHPGLVDAHLLRPGFITEHWEPLKQLAAHFLNREQMKWLEDYANGFCRLLHCEHQEVAENRKPLYHPMGH